MSSAETQAASVDAAARYYAGSQSGPRPGSREGAFLADRLAEAAATLRLVAEHRDAFAAIVKADST